MARVMLLVVLLLAGVAQAQWPFQRPSTQKEMFKCADAKGAVTYQDTACSSGAKVDMVIQPDGSKVSGQQYEAARKAEVDAKVAAAARDMRSRQEQENRDRAQRLEEAKARLNYSESQLQSYDRRNVERSANDTTNHCAEYIGRAIACGLDQKAFTDRCSRRIDQLTASDSELRSSMIKRMILLIPASVSIQKGQDFPCSAVQSALNGQP